MNIFFIVFEKYVEFLGQLSENQSYNVSLKEYNISNLPERKLRGVLTTNYNCLVVIRVLKS